MNRTIKFRAWDREKKIMEEVGAMDWAYGKNGLEIITVNTKTQKHYKMPDDWGEQPFVIMQFTGLHDKNGKEIYEGDIVRFRVEEGVDAWPDKPREITQERYSSMQCTWDEQKARWVFRNSFESVRDFWWNEKYGFEQFETRNSTHNFDRYFTKYVDAEVIGNIHENPELLK